MSRLAFAMSIALFASGSAAAVIVEQAKPAPSYETALARSWEDVHNKILTMAKDTVFPDDELGWKPHPDARSVMEELRHVTIGLEMTTAEVVERPTSSAPAPVEKPSWQPTAVMTMPKTRLLRTPLVTSRSSRASRVAMR